MSFKIASFNIQKFSRISVYQDSEGNSRKDLDTIARIILDNDIDIIAIQEIFHKDSLKALIEKISCQYAVEEQLKRGPIEYGANNIGYRTSDSYGFKTKHWEGRWVKPRSNYGDRIAEGYAFIWKRDRIKLVTNNDGKKFEPRIADCVGTEELVRPPLIGRFMPKIGSFEIRLINTHIVYRKPSNQNDNELESMVDMSDIAMRQREYEILINDVYKNFYDQVYDSIGHDKNAKYRPAYTFLLGDYNLNLPKVNGSTSSARIMAGRESILLEGKYPMCISTKNAAFTTIKKSSDVSSRNPGDISNLSDHLANNYDHFSYDEYQFIRHQIMQPQTGCIYAFNYYEDDNETKYDKYRKRISDHLPIVLEFDVRKKG